MAVVTLTTDFGLRDPYVAEMKGVMLGLAPDVRAYCVRRLVAALHEQLTERLRVEIERHDHKPPEATTIPDLIAGRRWLFGDDAYLIDMSHLGSVVQMSLHLPPGDPGIPQARDLCAYGAKLSKKMQSPGEPPFDALYRDADSRRRRGPGAAQTRATVRERAVG